MGSSFDLGDHYLLIAAYSRVVGELFKLLEELVAILEVHLSELFPSRTSDLFVGVLPEPRPKVRFKVLIGGVELFPISGLSQGLGL